MSADDWYLYKAAQCDQMAADAITAATRAKHEEDAELWRQIAREAATRERPTPP